ncbi:MAG: hypothetical protein U0074_01045 [Kouleothrix sp.]
MPAARAAANQALQLSPSEAEASYYLGRPLAALGERDLARRAFIQAAVLAHRHPAGARAPSSKSPYWGYNALNDDPLTLRLYNTEILTFAVMEQRYTTTCCNRRRLGPLSAITA